jgi:hypothetical protein
VASRTLGEEVGKGAIRVAMWIEEAEDAVETIPIVGDANESSAVGLIALADDVHERQTCFLEELSRDRRAAMDKLGAELDRCRGTNVCYGMYSSTNAVTRLENDGADVASSQLAGGRQASRTSPDDDDVSRSRHG